MIRWSARLHLLLAAAAGLSRATEAGAQDSPFPDSLLAQIRTLAHAVPGPLPRTLHYLKFAEQTAPLSAMVENAGDEPVIAAYTVFQVRDANLIVVTHEHH